MFGVRGFRVCGFVRFTGRFAGFGVYCPIVIRRSSQNSIANYLGLYSKPPKTLETLPTQTLRDPQTPRILTTEVLTRRYWA